jgi:hypothetical protein
VTTTVPYGVIVTGRMYVDGDLAVNGYLTGTNATSSTGIVVNNSGVTVNGLTNSVSIVANGSGSAAGDRSQLSVQPDNLSLTVLNPATQEAHGLTVNTQRTTEPPFATMRPRVQRASRGSPTVRTLTMR